jgi:hypothetical protein
VTHPFALDEKKRAVALTRDEGMRRQQKVMLSEDG